MASAFKRRFKEHFETIFRCFDTNQSFPQCQNIGIVVQTTHPGRRYVMANRSADGGMAVCCNGYPDPGSTHQNAQVSVTGRQTTGQFVAKIGIIDGIRTISPEINNVVPPFNQNFGKFSLERKSSVIGSKCNPGARHSAPPTSGVSGGICLPQAGQRGQ